jgi:DNA invertase Pin-like site-specific DNA recombinase
MENKQRLRQIQDKKKKKKKNKKTFFPTFCSLNKKKIQKKKKYIHIKLILHHGSSFKETTRDCLLRFATLTKNTERQEGAHHGRRTFCSPLRQATGDIVDFSI